MKRRNAVIAIIVALAACNRAPQDEQANAALNAPMPAENAAVNEAAEQDDREPLSEPQGPIDPKSVEAAGQVVQHFGALVEQGRWTEAEALWTDAGAAQLFSTGLRAQFREVHLEIGDLGRTEGAAGSIYTSLPVTFYGESRRGEPQRQQADFILRRVNDVPGSTEEQRRWHIERIDLKA